MDPHEPPPGSFAAALEDVRGELSAIEAEMVRQHGRPVVAVVKWLARGIERARSALPWGQRW